METLTEKLKAELPGAVKKVGISDIWKLRYKRGPIIREVFFKFAASGDKKKDTTEAYRQAERYVKKLGARDNTKHILIGVPEPFATDLDEEIEETTLP